MSENVSDRHSSLAMPLVGPESHEQRCVMGREEVGWVSAEQLLDGDGEVHAVDVGDERSVPETLGGVG